MQQVADIKNVTWQCPSLERRQAMRIPDQEMIAGFADLRTVKGLMEEAAGRHAMGCYVLPVWQNLESIALGTRILGTGKYFTPAEYCLHSPRQLLDISLDLTADPLMQTVVNTIAEVMSADYSEKGTHTLPVILEVEAPFTILSALMNPVDLYQYFEEEPELLTAVLHRITDAQVDYIKACLKAGCRIISLADPAGTMDLVGGDYYKTICGEAEVYLMRKCQPFLDRAIVHICMKMSRSLVLSGLASAKPYLPDPALVKPYLSAGHGVDYLDLLLEMASDPGIHFTGMTCIHAGLSRNFDEIGKAVSIDLMNHNKNQEDQPDD